MRATMLTLAALAVIVYLGLCLLLFLYQRNLIYFPQPRSLNNSTTTITLQADDARILVTTRRRIGSSALIYFGGNAEDVSYSLPSLAAAFPDHAIYLMHYRSYGGSSGKPTEAALFSDAVRLYDQVRTGHQNILVIGRSLGSGIAVHLASLRTVARLILVTPYHSIQEIAAQQFPYFPVRWLLRDKYESWKYAAQVAASTLVIAAEHDEVIPRHSTEALYRHFRAGVASLKVIAGTDHNSISESPDYMPTLKGGQ